MLGPASSATPIKVARGSDRHAVLVRPPGPYTMSKPPHEIANARRQYASTACLLMNSTGRDPVGRAGRSVDCGAACAVGIMCVEAMAPFSVTRATPATKRSIESVAPGPCRKS